MLFSRWKQGRDLAACEQLFLSGLQKAGATELGYQGRTEMSSNIPLRVLLSSSRVSPGVIKPHLSSQGRKNACP